MKYYVQFINLEDNDNDLIVSFAIDDQDMDIKSLILMRTLFFETVLDEEEKGVQLSLEGDSFKQENYNILQNISISSDEIKIKSVFREYLLDISKVQQI